jgi:hypothetical protein
MKLKFFGLMASMALLLSCGTTTQTSTSTNAAYDVPAGIQTSFTTQYPNASGVAWSRYDAAVVPIDWELTDNWTPLTSNDYAVQFMMDNNTYYAWYDANGNWIGTTYAVSNNNLPMAVNNLLQSQFSAYRIDKVQREMWKDRTAYEIKLKGDNDQKVKLLVAEDGTIIKQKLKD